MGKAGTIELPKDVVEFERFARYLERLRRREALSVQELVALWNYVLSSSQKCTAGIYEKLAKLFVRVNEPILAYEVAEHALKQWPENVTLLNQKALALARAGAARGAHAIIRKLLDAGHRSVEILCRLARTHKDFSEQATNAAETRAELENAHNYYGEALALATSAMQSSDAFNLAIAWDNYYYAGINVATTALLLGRVKHAKQVAESVRDVCRKVLAMKPEKYWAQATLGEAELILGNQAQAMREYQKAIPLAGGNLGDLGTTWKSARALRKHKGISIDDLRKDFKIPNIVIFAGHLIDSPERAATSPRFPESIVGDVRREIDARLEKLGECEAYCSAACGGDLLFAEAVLKRGQKLNVLLPFPRDEFRAYSVTAITPNPEWVERFNFVMNHANTKELLPGDNVHVPACENVALQYANKVITGLAVLHARRLAMPLTPIVLWNRDRIKLPGGTTETVELWESLACDKHKVDVIDITKIRAKKKKGVPATPGAVSVPRAALSSSTVPGNVGDQVIRAMLFADVYHYSSLKETQILDFVNKVMGGVAKLFETSAYKPVFENTWGDALYLVFDTVRDAGLFALELLDGLEGANKFISGSQLPPDLTFRIALHAGPVFKMHDPVLKRTNYSGKHVNRAARIEPITLPGHVFASEQFAALWAAENIREFVCGFVGHRQLPKNEGLIATYQVVRSSAGQ